MGIKYAVNENYFKTWNQEMAYVLGYFYADGSLEDASYLRGKYIRVSSAEKNNIVKIKKWLCSKHTIVEYVSPNINRRKKYLLRIGNHKLYDDLVRLGLFPNKSLTVKFPKIPKKYLSSFIGGYFDGDGCVRISRAKNKKRLLIIKKLSVVFTCGSKKYLETLAEKLNNAIKTKQLIVYNGHRSFMLSYSTGDSLKIFEFLYGNFRKEIFLRRKYNIFCEYLYLRPQRINGKIKAIIKKFNYGRVVK